MLGEVKGFVVVIVASWLEGGCGSGTPMQTELTDNPVCLQNSSIFFLCVRGHDTRSGRERAQRFAIQVEIDIARMVSYICAYIVVSTPCRGFKSMFYCQQ